MDSYLRQTTLGKCLRLTLPSRLRYVEEQDHTIHSKLNALQHTPLDMRRADENTALLADSDNIYNPKSLLVDWYDSTDPDNPLNWPMPTRVLATFTISLVTSLLYSGSSFWSVCVDEVVAEFGVSEVVAQLGTSVFILGFGFGPMVWSPLSETPSVGRVNVYIWTVIPYILCSALIPLSQNITIIIILRFVTGVLCSPILAVGGGTVADMFAPSSRGYPMSIWELSTWGGSLAGPAVAGLTYESFGWRGAMWELTAFGAVAFLLIVCLIPETYPAAILYRRAQRLSSLHQNANFVTCEEASATRRSLLSTMKSLLVKSITLNFREPIVFVLNLYVALVLATCFGMLESYPFVFEADPYNFTAGEAGIALLGTIPGGLFAMICYFIFLRYHQNRQFDKNGDIAPEERLWPAIPGGIFLPLSLFWYGWTAEAKLHWIVPAIGGFWFGIGGFSVFMAMLTYLPDAYPSVAATVLAGNCLVRALLSASFPLFITKFYGAVGPGWASSAIGFFALLFVPWPLILYYRGRWLRMKSPNARKDI